MQWFLNQGGLDRWASSFWLIATFWVDKFINSWVLGIREGKGEKASTVSGAVSTVPPGTDSVAPQSCHREEEGTLISRPSLHHA